MVTFEAGKHKPCYLLAYHVENMCFNSIDSSTSGKPHFIVIVSLNELLVLE